MERKDWEDMIGVIDVGGGLRGIFGAGVYDYCMEHGISFDCCIGVSAGAANMASFQAGQQFRNYAFYTEFSMRKEYMSLENFTRTGSYIDLEYVYGVLSNSDGEYPLDYEAIMDNPAPYVIVATNAETGEPVYFTKNDLKKDCYSPIIASSCVPVANKAYEIDGVPYFDGGLSDPIPYEKAFEMGCERVVVVLTRPRNEERISDKDDLFAHILSRSYPESARKLNERAVRYNSQLAAVEQLEAEGRALIIAPDDIGHLKTLTRDMDQLKALYRKGLVAAKALNGFM